MSNETFPNMRLYPFGYCAIFVKGASPTELLARAAGTSAQPIALSRAEADIITMRGDDIGADDLPGLDTDGLREAGLLEGHGTVLRAGRHGDWSFAVEAEGVHLAADEILAAMSRDTVALSLRESDSGSSWIAYAEDGDILSSFDPLFPDDDYGNNTARLEQLTRYREAISGGQRADAFVNAVRAIQHALRCTVPAELDEHRMPAIGIADGD
ncbi:hypothetical protein C7821_103435 [Streptomyces sp. VMFN-G11Ma]|nr:hypothetical protein C7821_103435 [Streptomyces sp. VMFN-G11Ma]